MEFSKRFEAKYKGTYVTCIMAQEFITLSKGSNSVKEYANKFKKFGKIHLLDN